MIDFSKCPDHLLFRLSPSTCLNITVHKFMVKCLCMDSSRNAVFSLQNLPAWHLRLRAFNLQQPGSEPLPTTFSHFEFPLHTPVPLGNRFS